MSEQESHLIRHSRTILETSTDGFCVVGLDGKFLEVNSSLCDITGYSREELLKMKLSDIEAKESPEEIAQHIDTIIGQGHERFETQHRRKDGKIIDVEISTQYCILDEAKFFFSFFRDITDIKQSIDDLRKSEIMHETLCRNIPGMVYKARPDWSVEFVSNSEAICGYCKEDISSKEVNWLDIVHPDDRKRILDEAPELNKKLVTTIQEYRIIAKDGSVRWVEDHKTSLFQEQGVFVGVDGIVFDITERKQTEEAFRESKDRFDQVAKNAQEWIWEVDADGIYTYSSPVVEDILGYKPEELVGKKNCCDLLHSEDREDVEDMVSETIAKKLPFHQLVNRCVHKNGKEVWLSTSGVPILDEKGNLAGYRGADTDITHRKRIESELEDYREQVLRTQKHAYIDSMGAIVAHQVNQPLTKISILLDRAIERIEEENSFPSSLKDVKESLAHVKEATSIIRKFRQYSQDPALKGSTHVSVNAVAKSILSVLSPRAERIKMRISIKGLEALSELEINETALEQLFLIIIQNALEAACDEQGHKLDIIGNPADDHIELQFADDCCGIAAETLDKIFEPFFSTKEGKGMGLGLDIVQQILISSGGQIRVESQLGEGTTFYVTLPISNVPGHNK